jgi:uncharacterized damage-inducible protein DinB
MRQHFQMFAAYNRWANGVLYEAAGRLSDADYRRDVRAFFHSMHGTLNHVLVGDLVWLHRFTGKGESPKALDLILHEDLEGLSAARRATDERIVDWVDTLDEAALAGRFTYITVTDVRTVSQRLAPALDHFFNHQTHHRGQAHMILSVLGHEPPPLDLIYFQRTEDGRAFA